MIAVGLLLSLLFSPLARADASWVIGGPTSQVRPTGLGLGILLGEPAGISGAYRWHDHLAVQGSVGWSFGQRRMHLGADGIITVTEIAADQEMGLHYPVYIGLGTRVRMGGPQNPAYEERSGLGVRFPLGVAIVPDDLPIEVFFEVAPMMQIIPSTRGGFDGGLGVRVYL